MKLRLCLLILLAALTGCHTTADSRYYALSPSSVSAIQHPPGDTNWVLSTVAIPDMLNRPQMVIQSNATQVRILEYDRWAAPLDTMIARILNENLQALLGIHSSATNDEDERRITVMIEEFGASDPGDVVLKATWSVKTGQGYTEMTTRHIFEKHQKVDTSQVSSIVTAMNQLLGDLAADIARAAWAG